MPDSASSLLIGAVGGLIAAATQHAFRRYAETEQVRREVVETHLLQLQDGVESLYYRMNNIQDWTGKSVMPDAYFELTSAYIFGRVLAHESLLVSKGIYAKLRGDDVLKREVKAGLHSINRAMDDRIFLHYHRVLLGQMALEGDRVLTFTEFLDRAALPKYAGVVASTATFTQSAAPERLEQLRTLAGSLVTVLAAQTGVPSAASLARDDPHSPPTPMESTASA
ncbi:MAG: hypothetical protein ABIP93_20140 [Gemmatimonadaceae bacterium]